MIDRDCITRRILMLLASTGKHMTRGEIRTALHLPLDTEVTARIREARRLSTYGRIQIATERVVLCKRCGETETARGGDVHCGGDCDDHFHDARGGCHDFASTRTEEYRYFLPESEMERAITFLKKEHP